MRKTMRTGQALAAVCLLAWLASAQTAASAIVGLWDFNDSDLIVDQGNGTLSTTVTSPLVQTFGTGTTVNAPGPTPAGNALALERAAGQTGLGSFSVDFALDLTGLQDLTVSWAWRADASWRSNASVLTGIQITYLFSTDGGASFNPIFQTVPPQDFLFRSLGGTVFSSADDSSGFVFRILQGSLGVAPGDQLLFDNFRFDASAIAAVPLPAAMPLFAGALGLLGFAGWRRKRRSA